MNEKIIDDFCSRLIQNYRQMAAAENKYLEDDFRAQ